MRLRALLARAGAGTHGHEAGLHKRCHHGVRAAIDDDDRVVSADLRRVTGFRLHDQDRPVRAASTAGDVTESALAVRFNLRRFGEEVAE